MNFFLVTLCVTVSSLLLWTTNQAAAQPESPEGGLSLGQWRIRPALSAELTYNDNISLSQKNKESDQIRLISPYLSVEHSLFDRGNTTLSYSGSFADYSKDSAQNWQTHQLDFEEMYNAPGGLIAEISGNLTDAEDPYGSENDYGEGQSKKRSIYSLNTKIGFDFHNRLKLFASLQYFKQDYEDDTLDWSQDYKNSEYGLAAQLRVLPKTWVFLRYNTGETDYYTASPDSLPGTPVNESNDADYSWQRVNIGATTDTTSKLRGELNFGYKWKNYDNTLDSYGNIYDDKNTWIAGTHIKYLKSPRTTLAFSLLRAILDSGSDTNDYYESTEFGISINHTFRKKLQLQASAKNQINDYNKSENGFTRSDDRYNIGLGVAYQMNRWVSLSTHYAFTDKNSNSSGNSYKNNTVSFSITGSI